MQPLSDGGVSLDKSGIFSLVDHLPKGSQYPSFPLPVRAEDQGCCGLQAQQSQAAAVAAWPLPVCSGAGFVPQDGMELHFPSVYPLQSHRILCSPTAGGCGRNESVVSRQDPGNLILTCLDIRPPIKLRNSHKMVGKHHIQGHLQKKMRSATVSRLPF